MELFVNFYHYKTVRVADVTPYSKNARTHSDDQIDQLRSSIRQFGWTNPVLIDEDGVLIAGHGRLEAAKREGMGELPAIVVAGLTSEQRRALAIADNKLALNAGWDVDLLREELEELQADGFDLALTGFFDEEIAGLLAKPVPEGNPDEIPQAEAEPVSQRGDVWLCGTHRVMCGDSTSVDDVAKLMNGERAALLHADPPYGMGKEADGVANDNLYDADLDRFQMKWWATFRTFLEDNANAYIWGTAPDLWRLWWRNLADTERLELRNEIVWDKGSGQGMRSAELTMFATSTERCLYFQLGNQFLGNINTADFPETWEPLRASLETQANVAGIKSSDVKRLCGVSMYGHWFTRSQFTLVPEKHYRTFQQAYPEAFTRPWADLKREWDKVKGGPQAALQGARSYFDNTHDLMRDVWGYSIVHGAERHGHATPKPAAMMERVMKTSLPAGGLCAEPFGGSGSTLIGAERTGRRCFTMELQEVYADVIVRRWQQFTGQTATLASNGKKFDEVSRAAYTT